MKQFLLFFSFLLLVTIGAQAQINVGSSTAPDSSAMLQISGTGKGFLPPRMSRSSMYSIVKPATGLLVFNTTDSLLFLRRDTGWVSLTAGEQLWQTNGSAIHNANSGFVGIGTSTPSTMLHIVGNNPLTLLGVADGTTTPTDSVLTIQNGLVKKLPLSVFALLFGGITSAIAPIHYTAGVISIDQASTTDDGYLSASDYNIFNNKVSSIALNGGTVYTTTSFGISGGAATATLNLNTQAKNRVFAGPISGANAQPTFRALVSADLPIATSSTLGAVSAGSGLSVNAAGVLSATNTSSGSVTSVSVSSANGLAGTVATNTTTPAITLSTTVTGMIKGNGTALSAATSGTDYAPGTSANTTGIVKSTTGTGALTTATASDFPTLNQNTTGTAANITGVLNATSHPALTGDVTTSAGSVATTISNSAVTNTKMANMAANTFKANNTASAAAPLDISGTQATALLDVFGTTKGLVPGTTSNTTQYLRADGTFAVPPGTNSNAGTVTSVSVTSANGVSGTVATNTTTPAISLTLGAITPSSVAASGTVTGSNLSGTNTGDETTATIQTKLGTASATTDGYLTKTDWNTFNNKATAANTWSITGNSGTSSATNFLGTTDNRSLRFRTNNLQRMILDSLGNAAIGIDTFDATNPERFLINAGNTNSVNGLVAKGTINNYFQMNIKNLSSGANATSDIVATADNGSETSNYVDLGINGSGYTGSAIQTGVANDGYLISSGNDFYMVNSSANKNMLFLTGGTGVANERMRILANGRVGMGVQDPTAPFVVKDTMEVRRVGSLSQLLFTNTAGSGDFRIGGDGGDIFWQGGGGRGLQMGSYWTTILTGDRQTPSYPAFVTSPANTGVLVLGQRDVSVPLGIQANSATQSANLTEWRNNSGTVLSAVTKNGYFGIGTSSPSTALQVSAASNPLTLLGVQTGAATDSILTIINGTVKKLSPSAITTSSSNAWALIGNSNTLTNNYFLGTTNTDPLLFKINSSIAGRLDGVNTFFGFNSGYSNGTTATQGTGIGYHALFSNTSGTYNTAIGYGALQNNVSGSNNIGVGNNAAVANNSSSSIAIGTNVNINNSNSIAIGNTAQTNNTNAISIGNNTYTNGNYGISIGSGPGTPKTQAYADYSVALGYNAYTGGTNSISIGSATNSSQPNAISIGNATAATGTNSVAIGYNAAATVDNTIVLGDKNNASVSVAIGPESFTAGAREKLLVDAGTAGSYNVISAKGSINNYMQLNVQNRNGGGNASSDLVATADNGDESNNYVDLGINSSGNTANYFGGAGDAYLYAQTQNMLIGTASSFRSVVFLTGGGTQSSNERMRIDGSGNVGIGTTSPSTKLHIVGTNPLTLLGVQTGTATSSDSLLTITNGLVRKLAIPNIGTVSSVSVTTANGVSGTVANSTTTPAISLTLGDITPTSVNTTGDIQTAGSIYVDKNSTNNATKAPGIVFGGTTSGETISSKRTTGGNLYGLDFYTNNLNRIAITQGGNVGIGVTNPAYKLHVVSNSDPLYLAGVNTGTNTSADSVLTITSGLVRKLPLSTFALPTNSWSTTGNSNTTPSSNFLGTTDNNNLNFRTNNAQRLLIDATGNVAIGTNPTFSTYTEKLLVDAGTTNSYNVISGKGDINNYLQLNIQNRNAGGGASSDVVATADNGDESNNYVDMGINSSGNNANVFGGANDAYLYAQSQNILIGTASASKSVVFMTGGTAQSNNERMRIDGNGKVGIGVTGPTAMLQLKAGTSSANTAPLKLTSGTNLSTPEAGAVEFDGTNYFVTTGSTRYTMAKTLTATQALDFPSTGSGSVSTLTITVNGAADGDAVVLGVPNAAQSGVNGVYSAYVSAANTVTVKFVAGGALSDPPSSTFRVSVLKY